MLGSKRSMARGDNPAWAASIEDVELTHLFVDAAAMMLIRKPKQFSGRGGGGKRLTAIFSDGAAMLTKTPSAYSLPPSLGHGSEGLYEPVTEAHRTS